MECVKLVHLVVGNSMTKLEIFYWLVDWAGRFFVMAILGALAILWFGKPYRTIIGVTYALVLLVSCSAIGWTGWFS